MAAGDMKEHGQNIDLCETTQNTVKKVEKELEHKEVLTEERLSEARVLVESGFSASREANYEEAADLFSQALEIMYSMIFLQTGTFTCAESPY